MREADVWAITRGRGLPHCSLYAKGYRRFGLVWADDERAAIRRKGLESVLA